VNIPIGLFEKLTNISIAWFSGFNDRIKIKQTKTNTMNEIIKFLLWQWFHLCFFERARQSALFCLGRYYFLLDFV